jgi:dipeptidyl aminopeptidase/acylaminoacyl peptidase
MHADVERIMRRHVSMAALAIVAAASTSIPDATLMSAARQGAPATEIYLAPFTEGVKVDRPVNISNNPGYDNQPYFLPDSSALLFASNRDGKQNDIYRYDITKKVVTQVTHTPENEYSPTMTPDGRTFTTVRGVEQRLWRFNLDGSDAGMVWGDRGLIGYHAWISPERLAVFVLGKPNTLELIDLPARSSDVVESSIGRSLHVRPGRGTLTFVHKPAGGRWAIKELDAKTRKIETLTETLEGSEDFAWTPGGLIVMGTKSRLSYWKPEEDRWLPLADFGDRGLTAITRLAISPDGKWIAIVSTAAAK